MKKSRYQRICQQWRAAWVEDVDCATVDVPDLYWKCVLTCSTQTCANYGFFWRDDVPENPDGVYRILCGLCHEAIVDIDPLLEDDEEFRLNCHMPDGSIWTEEQ